MIVTAAPARFRPTFDVRIGIVVAITAAAAAGIEIFWIATWPGRPPADYRLLALLVLMAATASHFPVELTPKFKTNTATAVHFTILLLYPPPLAVGGVGIAVLLGNGTLALRRNSTGRRRRGLYDTIFNTSQAMIAIASGATLLYALRRGTPLSPPLPVDVFAIPLAGAGVYLTTTSLVSLVVGLQTKRQPLDVWLSSQRFDVPSEAALYLIGFITALITSTRPWAPLAMVIPTAVVYLATKRAVVLNEQTIAAVEAMADMVDMRDRYTADHSRRVAANVGVIAAAMGVSRGEVARVRLAARVHDLGKIALPDSILSKEGKLTAEEFALMRDHPRLGFEILAKFPQYEKGREIVLAHHERIDGRGYPRGLSGDQIPLGAQIVAVADALDAMTSHRSYRAALPLHQAMTELRLGRGMQWSHAVVDTVDRLVSVGEHALSIGPASTFSTA
jgi:HD-GYP domain-containing protein (c-di-GMP phosphodiesterase class II)